VFWLQRPPYWRWAAASLLIVWALWAELAPAHTVRHPFLASDLPAGAELNTNAIAWREVPADLLPAVEPAGRAGRDLWAGEPLLPSDLSTLSAPPPGWLVLSVPLPTGAHAGARVRLVVVSDDPDQASTQYDGLVVSIAESSDPFGSGGGTVAIPPEAAVEVAPAVLEGRVAVLVEG
jgi:hypothetical protein